MGSAGTGMTRMVSPSSSQAMRSPSLMSCRRRIAAGMLVWPLRVTVVSMACLRCQVYRRIAERARHSISTQGIIARLPCGAQGGLSWRHAGGDEPAGVPAARSPGRHEGGGPGLRAGGPARTLVAQHEVAATAVSKVECHRPRPPLLRLLPDHGAEALEGDRGAHGGAAVAL